METGGRRRIVPIVATMSLASLPRRRWTYKCGQTMCSRIARSFRLPCPIPSLPPSLALTGQAGRLIKRAGGVTANFSCQNERDVSGIVSPPSAANKTDEAALNSTRNRFYPPVPIESPASLHPIPSLAHTDAQICLSVAVSRLFRSFDFGLRHEQEMGMISAVDLS